MHLDLRTLPWNDAYKYLIGSILPRPIAFVSTVDANGCTNLAPFSFFTVASANPPTLCFTVMRRGTDGAKKDTLQNIEATREFVINIVSEPIVEQMNKTAAEFPPDVSEFAEAGLTPVPSLLIRAPRVKESLVNFECRLSQIVEIGGDQPGAAALILGEVVQVHVDDAIHENGKINIKGLQPVGRMAGQQYVRATDVFELIRPK